MLIVKNTTIEQISAQIFDKKSFFSAFIISKTVKLTNLAFCLGYINFSTILNYDVISNLFSPELGVDFNCEYC